MSRRLALPVILDGGRAVTVEQGSDADLEQSVALALRTVLGERVWAPQVGLAPQQGRVELDPAAIRQAIAAAALGVDDSAIAVEVLNGGATPAVRVTVGRSTVEVAV